MIKKILQSGFRHVILITLGIIFLVLGVLGLFLPLLQGILFLTIGVALLVPYVPAFARARDWLFRKYPAIKSWHDQAKIRFGISDVIGEEMEKDWGAVFDWDGVIVDSSAFHEQSWVELAAELGRDLPADHFLQGFGRKNEDIIPNILKWSDQTEEIQQLAQRKEEIYRELLQKSAISPLPGVREWLKKLQTVQIPCVIASSTERANIDCLLSRLELEEYFAEIVSGDDVEEGKPNPQVFLLASERIGISGERCVVFEDAQVGITAAQAAGMKVVAVTTTHPANELAQADLIVPQLDNLKVTKIKTLLEQ